MAVKAKTKPAQTKAPEYLEAVIPNAGVAPDSIRISAVALAAIVRRAACSVDGVTRITGSSLVDNIAEFVGSRKVLGRAIQIAIQKSTVSVELSINIRYGVSLPKIASEVQREVASQLEELTGLQVMQVNVIIREMEDPAEIPDEEESI